MFALIGGGLGSVLTWTLYGFSFGEGVSAPLAHRLYESGRLSQFASQFLADMLIDLADKSITVVVVAAVWNLTPEALRKRLYFTGWRQTPLTDETLAGATRTPVRRMSLRAKITLLVGSAMIIVAAVITAISFDQYRDIIHIHHKESALWIFPYPTHNSDYNLYIHLYLEEFYHVHYIFCHRIYP